MTVTIAGFFFHVHDDTLQFPENQRPLTRELVRKRLSDANLASLVLLQEDIVEFNKMVQSAIVTRARKDL